MATKNQRSYRAHELLQIVQLAGNTSLVRAYTQPLNKQTTFAVHNDLLRKVDIHNMILHNENLEDTDAMNKFYNRSTGKFEADEKQKTSVL